MQDNKTKLAVDAIKQTKNKSAVEKLVLFQLSRKHEMGSSKSVNWKGLDDFINDFSEKWQSVEDIAQKTNLSTVKISRAIETLAQDDLVVKKTVEVKTKKAKVIGEHEVISLTPKVFESYKKQLELITVLFIESFLK